MYTSLFESFFQPTRIIVVSEEKLRHVEREQKARQLEVVESRIKDLTQYKAELEQQVAALSPAEVPDKIEAAA